MAVSLFCLLFVTCFCALASSSAQQEWVTSSGFSILVDMVAF